MAVTLFEIGWLSVDNIHVIMKYDNSIDDRIER